MHIAMMGDPTLRMTYVAPASNVEVVVDGKATISWDVSSDDVRYNIYRASTANGPFVLLAEREDDTSYEDSTTGFDDVDNIYMVRAVRLEDTPSGTYYSLSQGAFNDLGRVTYTGSSGADTFIVRVDPTDADNVQVIVTPYGGSPTTHTLYRALLTLLTINGLGGNDQLTVNDTYGAPMPTNGINFIGGSETDSLIVTGSANNSTSTFTGTILSIAETSFGSSDIVLTDVEQATVNGGNGDDTLTLDTPTPAIVFNGNASTTFDTLNVASGSYTFEADANAGTTNSKVVVAEDALVTFNATQHLSRLEVYGEATLSVGGTKFIVTKELSVNTANGRLDLTDNDLILDYTGSSSAMGTWTGTEYTGVFGMVASGYAGGNWDGFGIVTSMTDATTSLTTLGVAFATDVLDISSTETAVWSGGGGKPWTGPPC